MIAHHYLLPHISLILSFTVVAPIVSCHNSPGGDVIHHSLPNSHHCHYKCQNSISHNALYITLFIYDQ